VTGSLQVMYRGVDDGTVQPGTPGQLGEGSGTVVDGGEDRPERPARPRLRTVL
jgi:hypothetical protein